MWFVTTDCMPVLHGADVTDAMHTTVPDRR